jgi:hypothetical protein
VPILSDATADSELQVSVRFSAECGETTVVDLSLHRPRQGLGESKLVIQRKEVKLESQVTKGYART